MSLASPLWKAIRSIQLPSRWLAAQASVQHDGRQVLKQCELVPQECSPNIPIIKESKMDNWKPKEFQRKPQEQMIVNGQCSIFRLDCQSFRWDNARNTPALLPTSQLWWCLKGRDPGTASQTHRWPQVSQRSDGTRPWLGSFQVHLRCSSSHEWEAQ